MYFFKLIRPINLLVIVLTMYACRWFVLWFPELLSGLSYLPLHNYEPMHFALLVFSTVLIAAAGNIINDYFDVKADRINKPEQLIIGKHIKPRWAIISHIGLNTIALVIALFLSLKLHSIWFVICHLFTISCLWYYSTYYKKKPLLGNLIVAGLTALVPLLIMYYMYYHYGNIGAFSEFGNDSKMIFRGGLQGSFALWYSELHENGIGLILLCFTAFMCNLAREILKDMEDVEGDKVIHAKTIPMIFGFKKSKQIISSILLILILFFISLLLLNSPYGFHYSAIIFLPIGLSLALLVCAIVVLQKAVTRKKFKKADLLIKIAFFVGLSLPFYWQLIF
jgi:4-hydroxybenzoate polyprenyltransferase